MTLLPVARACELDVCAKEHSWLVDQLWAAQAVGIIGGEPKCCKSFLALELAVAVACGGKALGRFPANGCQRVILYAAEDALHVVRERLEGSCAAAGVDLAALDILVITSPTLRLDLEADRGALADTLAQLRPGLLILDPFVRLHRVDENASGEVAPLLAFLRGLQRQHQVAIAVVHHAKKGAGKVRGGQALRGSSEFHAWGDSNLYLRRHGEQLSLTVEHRSAASLPAIAVKLDATGDGLALRVVDSTAGVTQPSKPSLSERVEQALLAAERPLSVAALREACRVRTATLCSLLADLSTKGRVQRTPDGYILTAR
jgi:hypothetical protein